MRKARLLAWSLAIILAIPALASAQGRMPHKDAGAVGADVGLFLPRADALKTAPIVEGFYEYYLSARDSLRVGAGWVNSKFARENVDSVRQIRIAVDLVHNWEGGAVHPFVGAGLGTYFLQFRDNGTSVGDSETKVGGTVFGGVEFFTSNTFAVKGEVRYHIVSKVNDFNPSGLAFTIGVKSYF